MVNPPQSGSSSQNTVTPSRSITLGITPMEPFLLKSGMYIQMISLDKSSVSTPLDAVMNYLNFSSQPSYVIQAPRSQKNVPF